MPSSLIYATRMNHFFIGLLYTMTSDVRPVMTSSVVELRKSSKVLCKAKLAPKERSWSLFGDLLPIWSTIAFWIPVKPWHLRSMPSKLMRCTKNCNACSLYWSTERAQFFSTTTSDCMSHNQHFKRWKNWATKFVSPAVFTQPATTCSSISTTFCREKYFHSQQDVEKAFQELVVSWGTDFYATAIAKLISHCQTCDDCNGFYFD